MGRVSKATSRETEIGNIESQLRNEVRLTLKNRKRRQKDLLEAINNHYENFLLELPGDILEKCVSQLTHDDICRIKNKNLEVSAIEGGNKLPRASRAKGNKQSNLAPNTLKVNKFQTPMNQNIPAHHMGTVTPKFNPYAPMSVVRVPKEGEVAMSLTGSPLRVTSVINESKPNVIVPLHNGRILSVMPERGLRLSQIPEMDDDLISQLQVLNDNLTTLLSKPSKGKSTTKKK